MVVALRFRLEGQDMSVLDQWDPELAAIVHREEERHRLGLELIASENYASTGVLAALGTVLATKYAEGYPGKRYYGGCQYMDEVEELAISRAKELFFMEWIENGYVANFLRTWTPSHTSRG